MLTKAKKLVLKELLDAGAHFGHQTHKWNPKMKKYVYGERNGIYIIDLTKTIPLAQKAYDFLKQVATEGRPVLFVATKRQAADVVKKAAKNSGAFYVTYRWPGGMLTNYKTIGLSVDRLKKVDRMKENGDFRLLTKKEQAKIDKEVAKLERNLGGIKDMRKLPGAIFVVDPNCERIAIKEAQTLGLPVVAITDTNCDPEGIDYVVPGNDDAAKSIALFTEFFAQSVQEGNTLASKKSNRNESSPKSGPLAPKDKGNQELLAKFDKDVDLLAEGKAGDGKGKGKGKGDS